MSARALAFLAAVAAGALAASACDDPTHDNDVGALGAEPASPGPGPMHRPGQPCVTCHGGSGPGKTWFAVGGTVFAVKDQAAPLAGVDVQLTDANSVVRHATTNASGNFYITHDDWQPTNPIHVQLNYAIPDGGTQDDGGPQILSATMGSHVGRDGSCADCHFDPAGPRSPGHVYMAIDPSDLQPAGSP